MDSGEAMGQEAEGIQAATESSPLLEEGVLMTCVTVYDILMKYML